MQSEKENLVASLSVSAMAKPSPALTNPTADNSGAGSTPPTTKASKNLRGLNKPKCIKCGNVARSRCPFQSCKSCCAKAQNPCHIHVLKGPSNLPDKAPSSGSPIINLQSTEASHPGASYRPASFRQLSTYFAQFNNLQTPLRSRKPLTRKDAEVINEWRFLKVKEFRDSNIEMENEAFDRYMQNISLLEEVFGVNSAQDEQTEVGSSSENPKPASEEVSRETMVAGFKLQLRSDPVRIENTRKRMQYIVDEGLKKLRKLESAVGGGDLTQPEGQAENRKTFKSPQAEWNSALGELIDKINKARNEEDLKACWEMKNKLFNRDKKEKNEVNSDGAEASKEPCLPTPETSFPLKGGESGYSPPKWFSTVTIDDEELRIINAEFDASEHIKQL